MNKSQLLGACCAAVVAACLSAPSLADFGFGDYEAVEPLQARNWNPDTGTWEAVDCPGNTCSSFSDAEAVYVPALDMTWWRFASGIHGPDAPPNGCSEPNSETGCPYNSSMTKREAESYLKSLNCEDPFNVEGCEPAYGINTWRLPKIGPHNGTEYIFSPYVSCDIGDSGIDIGYWNDDPSSELSYLYYVALGAKPKYNYCPRGDDLGGNSNLFWSKVAQAFNAIQQSSTNQPLYWADDTIEDLGWDLFFNFDTGFQTAIQSSSGHEEWVWVVTDGDIAQSPVEKLANLIDSVMTTNKNMGLLNSLDSKFNNAIQALDDANTNNDIAALNNLNAFIYSVEAQRVHLITEEDADALIEAAQAIIGSLNLN